MALGATREELEQVLKNADCLHDPDSVMAAVQRMARDINADFADKDALVLAVMNGGLVPCGCLLQIFEFLLVMVFVVS